jgi:hypothetical protein
MHEWWRMEFWGWHQWAIAAGLETLLALPLVLVFGRPPGINWITGEEARRLRYGDDLFTEATMTEVPMLYGDRVHDDAPALQAIADGKPFKIAPDAPFEVEDMGGKPVISAGEFRLSFIPTQGPNPSAYFDRPHYYCDPGVKPPFSSGTWSEADHAPTTP